MDFLINLANGIYNFVLGLPWERIFFSARFVFIILDVVLLAALIYVFVKALEYRPKFVLAPATPKKKKTIFDKALIERWQKILKKAESSPPQSLTIAIIEADSFVDDILKKTGIRGEHMADRMEVLGSRNLKTLEKLWQAHRIRNDVVHTPDFIMDPVDAKRILGDYEAFLKEFGVLQ